MFQRLFLGKNETQFVTAEINNIRERTRQNCSAVHTFPNLFIPIKCKQYATHN